MRSDDLRLSIVSAKSKSNLLVLFFAGTLRAQRFALLRARPDPPPNTVKNTPVTVKELASTTFSMKLRKSRKATVAEALLDTTFSVKP